MFDKLTRGYNHHVRTIPITIRRDHLMSANSRFATSPALARLNRAALNRGLNRVLPANLISALDPSGFSIVTDVLVHEHAGGESVAPHFRCRVLAKVAGSDEPEIGYLDVAFEDFEALPKAQRLVEDVLGAER